MQVEVQEEVQLEETIILEEALEVVLVEALEEVLMEALVVVELAAPQP